MTPALSPTTRRRVVSARRQQRGARNKAKQLANALHHADPERARLLDLAHRAACLAEACLTAAITTTSQSIRRSA